MPNSMRNEGTYSAEMARASALNAVAAIDRLQQPVKPKNKDRFAQNTWGALTVCCLVAAIGFSFLPENNTSREQSVQSPPVNVAASDAEVVFQKISKLSDEIQLKEIAQNTPAPLEVVDIPTPMMVDSVVTASIENDAIKNAEVQTQENNGQPIPELRTGFGVDIGGSDNILALESRYLALQSRAPDLFDNLRPIIRVNGNSVAKETRLVAGPFADMGKVARFCRALRLRLTVDCTESTYEGSPLDLASN